VIQRQPFGRYEVLRRICMGGMAEVFLARHLPSGTMVALKRILPGIAEDEEFIAMFEDEARIASQIEHPYIARCLDFGQVGGEWFIAFEFVYGKDLRALFARCAKNEERPPLWFLCYLFARIAEGLAYAHARKDANGAPVSIVHRDVSPQNIIVSFDGDVKLIDFGIAKAAGKVSRTQTGIIKGKFAYMSPEQVRGQEVDLRTDIFSLGICLWELITMQRLFSAENELLVLEKVLSLRVERPSRYSANCPPELDRIVLKALAKDPDERYRAAEDFYRDLNHVAGSLALVSREQIAQYMRRAFPDVHQGSGNGPEGSARQVREMSNMTTQNDKNTSDLDIFEGLGKKGPTARPPAPPHSLGTPPPPPPRAAAQDAMRRTLLGVTPPPSLPPPPPTLPPPAMSREARTPPPPPGRGSLPPVVGPPPRGTSAPPAGQAVASAPPTPRSPSPSIDMEWDDEDEATQIFDKVEEPHGTKGAAPAPAAGNPPPSGTKSKSTLLGLTAPMMGAPAPSSLPRLTPPPPAGSSYGRPSTTPPGLGFPPPPSMHPPLAPVTQQGLGMNPLMSTPSTAPPPPPPAMRQTNPLMGAASVPTPPSAPAPDYRTAPRSVEATAVLRQPTPSRAGLWVGLAAVGVAAIGLAVFLLMPRTGRITINVIDAKSAALNRVDIFVDGRKTPCETAPCIVDQISAGSHEVKVIADGYDTASSQSVNVESGKDATAAFALTPTAKAAGIKVSGAQAGVKLYVDGKELGPLPQEVRDLTPGDHTLRISGSERYQPLEKHVTVEPDSLQDLGTITLKVLKGKATIALATSGARVFLISGSDRRELPMLPISVDIDTTKTWALQATKLGYTDYNQPITFDDGQAEKSFTVTLDPKGAAIVSMPVYSQPASTPSPAPPAASPGTTSGEGSEAFLNINSIPPSTCFLDGRSLGSTPKVHVSVKPGSHTVKFVNADEGLSKTISVNVGAGETKPAVAKLQ
jgi:eukaryotic-like serine/threonine-protein kinase